MPEEQAKGEEEMSRYWSIILSDIKPLPGKMDELLSILKEYRFNIYYNVGSSFDASFYDWRSYDLADNLCTEIAPLIASGTMHASDEDDEDGVMTVFRNGSCEDVSSQSFVFYDGIDDPWAFAQSLPDSVKQAILAHADEIKSASVQNKSVQE